MEKILGINGSNTFSIRRGKRKNNHSEMEIINQRFNEEVFFLIILIDAFWDVLICNYYNNILLRWGNFAMSAASPLGAEINICINMKFCVMLWMIKHFHSSHQLLKLLENFPANSDGFCSTLWYNAKNFSLWMKLQKSNFVNEHFIQRIQLGLPS